MPFNSTVDRQNRRRAEINKFLNSKALTEERHKYEENLVKQYKKILENESELSPEYSALQRKVDLYYTDRQQWRMENASELGRWNPAALSRKIAPFMSYRMADLAQPQGANIIVPMGAIYKNSSLPKIDDQLVQLYSGLDVRTFYKTFTYGKSRKTTGMDFIYQGTGAYVKGTMYDAANAVKNIKNKNGRVVVWDLETFGRHGIDAYNKAQRITEFSFSDGIGSFEKGDFRINKTYGSIIGLSEKEHQKMMRLIDRFSKNKELTDGELVTLNRLALHGNSNTTIDWDHAHDGVVRFSSFAEKKDLTSPHGTVQEMIKGADLLREIGKYQEDSRTGSGMFGWEKELVEALHNIVSNDLTATGYNINSFDIPQLDALISNKDLTTQAFRDEVSKLFNGEHLHFNHTLDMIIPLKDGVKDPYEFWHRYMGGDKEKTNKMMHWMKAQGETPKTQQTVLAAMAFKQGVSPDDIHHGQAHIAESDAIDAGRIIFGSSLYDPDAPTSMIKTGKVKDALKLKGNGTQLFYARNSSWNPATRGLVSFTYDSTTDQWWSSDGVAINKQGDARALYQAPGTRRRALYSLEGINKLESNSPLNPILSNHSNLAGGDLYAVRWRPHSHSKISAAQRDVVWVGTYKDIIDNINSMMTLAATKPNAEADHFSMTGLPQHLLDSLSTVTVGPDGKYVRQAANLDTLMDISTRAFNDAAGRIARDKNLSRDINLIHYINDMDTFVAGRIKEGKLAPGQITNEVQEKFRQEFRENIFAKTLAIYKQHISTGKSYDELDTSGTLIRYFGYHDKSGELKAYADSMENSAALEQWGRKNYGLITAAVTATRDRFGDKNSPEARYYYRQVREMLEDAAINKTGKAGAGYNVLPRVMSELDKFQVDLDGFYGIKSQTGSTIAAFDINGDYNVVNTLMRKMGKNKRDANNAKEDEKLTLLKNFQEFLLDKGIINLHDVKAEETSGLHGEDFLIDVENDSESIAGAKITHLMRLRRGKNAMAGILSTTEQFDIIDNLENGGLTDNDIAGVIEQARDFNFEIAQSFKPVTGKDGRPMWFKNSPEGQKFNSWVKRVASDINRGIVFNNGFDVSTGSKEEGQAFVNKLMKKAGYSEADAKMIYKMQRARFSASQEMLENIVGGIYTHGGALGYNVKSGQFWVYNTADDVKANNYTIVGLDRNVWNNGAFKRRLVNGQEFADEVGMYYSEKAGGLIFSTEEGRYAKDSEGLMRFFFNRGKEEGNLAKEVSNIIGSVDKLYRQHSADYYGDRADRVLANVLNINEFSLADLGETHRKKLEQELRDLGTQAGDIMADYIHDGKKTTLQNASSSLASAALQTLHITMPYFTDNVIEGRADLYNLFGGTLDGVFQHIESHSGDTRGQVRILANDRRGLMAYNKDLNHISNKMNRALPFNLERAQRIMAGRGARFGSALQSMEEHMHMNAISEGLGYTLEDTMVVNKLSATSENMRKLMAYAAKKLGKDSYEYQQMMLIFTDEASGAISAFAADAGLEAEHYEQHVAFGKISRSDIENNRNFNKFLDASSEIVLDNNGKLQFRSKAGVYVREDEELFIKASNNPNMKDETVRAKQDGLLRSGVFKNGHRMTDEAVSDYLNAHIDPSLKGEERTEAAWGLLTKSNSPLSHDYYVESLDIAGHTKNTDRDEKQMSHVLMNGLGMGSQESDRKIAKTLKLLGAGELVGRQIHFDIIEEMMQKGSIKGTRFAAYVRGMAIVEAMKTSSEKKRKQLLAMTDSKIDDIITRNFGGVSKFAAALEEERYRTSRLMDNGLHEAGIKGYVDVFGNTAAGLWKHGGPSAFETVFNALIDEKGFTHEQAKEILEKYGAVKGIKIHTNEDGSKWAEFVSDDSKLDIDGLNKVTDKYFAGKNGWHDSVHELETENGKVQYEVARTQVRTLPNYNVGKSEDTSTFKADERTVDSLKTSVYTKDYLDKSEKEITGAFGNSAFSRSVIDFNKAKKDGDLANQLLLNDFMRNAFVHDGNPNKVQGSYYMLKDGETAQSAKRGMAWLKERGVDEKTAQRAIKGLQKIGIDNATANKVLDLIEANSAANAHEFNRSAYHKPKELEKLGFKSLTIDELRTNARIQHKTEDEFAESLYGQAIVLDLHSSALGEKGQVYEKESERYIALPFSALQQTDKTGATRKSSIQRKMARIASQMNEYENEFERNINNGDVNAKRKEAISANIDQLRSLITEQATTKNGAIKKAAMAVIGSGTVYGTAQGFEFLGGGLDGALGKAHFLDSGKTFTELADARTAKETVLDPGFLFASNYHRDKIYNDELFEKIAGGDKKLAAQIKQKTFSVLNREGTIAVDQRYPLVSRDAVQPVNMHFSDMLGRDEFRVNIKTFKQQNGDFDSDKLNAMIRHSEAEITLADGTTTRAKIDFATYRAIDSMDGIEVKLLDNNFDEAKASMVRNAIDVTPYGQPQQSKWGKEEGLIADDSYGVSNLKEYTYDGHRLVNYDKTYTADERKANKQLLETLNARYKDLHPEEFDKIWDSETNQVKDDTLYSERMGNFVAQNYGKEEADAYDEALHYRKWEMSITERMNEAASKKAAGIMNKSLFEFSRIAKNKANLTGRETEQILIGLMALQEGALTGKNNRGEQDLERAEKLQEVWGNAIKAMRTGENREEAATELENFVGEVFKDRAKKEFGPRSAMIEPDTDALIDKTRSLFGRIVRDTTINSKEQRSMMIGISASGLKASEALNYSSSAASDSMMNQTMEAINAMNEEAGVQGAIHDMDDTPSSRLQEKAEDARKRILESMENNRNARYRRAATEAIEETAKKAVKHSVDIAPLGGGMAGKVIAASVGIAAGLMTAGYAAGPSVKHDVPAPAQTQAMQMTNDQNDQVSMQQMSLSDSNLNVMRGGPNSGYLININAQTSQGQQAAVDAITYAASGMTPQSGSVNVNLSTSIGNSLSQLQVNRMVANAIGIA